ncbi:YetF domain-containing protein [Bacillus sp. M6-12]|uniref:YetF domain-containing protein n=1 Tax=Bacillus sp. M6-12 TaxID=2054166 RepID=UPI0035B52DDD
MDPSLSIRNGLIALVGWSAFTIALGVLDLNSIIARKVIVGEPRIVIKKGKIMENELQKVRLDLNSLKKEEKCIFAL